MASKQNQVIRVMKNKAICLLLILAGIILIGCSVKTTETEEVEMTEHYQIQIQSVSVLQGDKIELTGTTSLPDGNCVYTRLSGDGNPVDWWPVGKCFPITGPDWKFSIPLGKEGAPDDLDHKAAYTVKVWWPGAPEVTLAEFPFDISAPPAP